MKIWIRLGVMLDVNDKNGELILNGDETALLNVINNPNEINGTWKIEGESYIPLKNTDIEFDI